MKKSRILKLVLLLTAAVMFLVACTTPEVNGPNYDEDDIIRPPTPPTPPSVETIVPASVSTLSFCVSNAALLNPDSVVTAFGAASGWTITSDQTDVSGRTIRAQGTGGEVFGLFVGANNASAQAVYDNWLAAATNVSTTPVRFGPTTVVFGSSRGMDILGIALDEDVSGGVVFYNNVEWNNYGGRDGGNLVGQWPLYGIGDPFIMRWNGMFYMYVSTRNCCPGIRAWKSRDLINWEQAGGRFCYDEGDFLPLGYVVSPNDWVSQRAYAPEVWYWNGTFYLYTSPAGAGHYIYTSNHPEGPFLRQTDNIGLSIDGNVFIDNDGWKHFTRAYESGILVHRMSDMLSIDLQRRTFGNTALGGWVEGSEIIYRRGLYFMTYTGRHVVSPAYRVYYNWARSSDRSSTIMGGIFEGRPEGVWSESFLDRRGMDLPTILNTEDPEFRGIGHNTIVMGPDMDSHYMAYHNLNSRHGPNRSFNIDRMNFNGAQMTVAASPTRSIAPRMPVFWAGDTTNAAQFVTTSDKVVSTESSGAVFSAEFNFRYTNALTVAVNYVDANNFDAVDINLSTNRMSLRRVTNGNSVTVVGDRPIIQRFEGTSERLKLGAMHTIRIAQGDDGLVDVYFNNLRRIGDQAMPAPGVRAGGKIAYILNNADNTVELSFTAFSDVARGLSDRLEVNQYHGRTGAANFDPSLPYSLSSGASVSEVEFGHHHGAMQLRLGAGDYVSYNINFNRSGAYGIELTFPAAAAGSTIRFVIEGGVSITATLPDLGTNHPFSMRTYLGSIPVLRGVRRVTVEAVGGDTAFIAFRMFGSTLEPVEFEHSLAQSMGDRADYRLADGNNSAWQFVDGAHHARSGYRHLVFVGNRNFANFVLDIDLRLAAHGVVASAGIVFHATNFAPNLNVDQGRTAVDDWRSIQGYYLAFANSGLSLNRLNYDLSLTVHPPGQPQIMVAGAPSPAGVWISRRLVVNGASVRLYNVTNRGAPNESSTFVWESLGIGRGAGVHLANEGGRHMGGSTGFVSGQIALYTNGAEASFRNLRITAVT